MAAELKSGEMVVSQGDKVVRSYLMNEPCDVSVVVEQGAQCVYHILCGGELQSDVKFVLKKDSCLKLILVDVARGTSQVNVNIELAESGARFEFNGLYIVGRGDRKDVVLDVKHLVADCYSSELMKGIAAEDGVGRFHGRIYVAQDAQRTEAYQQSRNLLLNNAARIFTEPQLEIYADDVKCSHGAVVGQIEDEAVYYMRQRGIDEKAARNLLTEGFASEIVWQIEDEQYAEQIHDAIEERLSEI